MRKSAPEIRGENQEIQRLQAEHFCDALHAELVKLDQGIDKLRVTLTRQTARRELRRHARVTEYDLRTATAERERIAKMLAALGHPYPCGHGSH